ncbi:hypothetical protein KIPB_014619, partial [Kipferlia bialata]|eukprot:g14619.t1
MNKEPSVLLEPWHSELQSAFLSSAADPV